ncbi:hypothetical protein [Neorhodopirellula pilleata]|uniref:Uncharacterized protein n=1 Tax=Neorhodopirellula pilleata TaxID=2714738 RepID=A0A5C6A7T3_9BACT|nr:hypothetical protein [Neorhodopirellula pilleata]TWT95447.1 hypothetical protein Pla100_30880 [Neorhodopirellula pilleata]
MAAPPPKSRSVRRSVPPVTLPGGVELVSPLPTFISKRSDETYLRIDGPEPVLGSQTDASLSPISASVTASSTDPEAWLTYHATDLIARLSEWADDLSVRESNLHAREAAWERQARRLRLQFQETQIELEQLAASLREEREELAEQQIRIERTAREIALASDYWVG